MPDFAYHDGEQWRSRPIPEQWRPPLPADAEPVLEAHQRAIATSTRAREPEPLASAGVVALEAPRPPIPTDAGILRFITGQLRNPETGRPFELYEEEARFLAEGFRLTPDDRLPYPELVFAAPKKSGKTALAAMALLYTVVVLGGKYAEGYCIANDLEQAQGRVFQAAARMVEAGPLGKLARVSASRIDFPSTGAVIQAVASDYAGAAGGNPTMACFDELWAYTSERSHRLWDEMVPPPTRQVAARLTVSYAGFESESKLLEDLYKRGLNGELIGPDLYSIPGELLMYWGTEPRAPWQTPTWIEQMRSQLRPNAFLRMVRNVWVSGEESFIPVEYWDAAASRGQRLPADQQLTVSLGVDAGLKRDSAAVVACAWDQATKHVRLVAHRIFTPRPGEPLDLEETLEAAIRDLGSRFHVREVRYDPWQFARSAQTLDKAGLPMREFPQSTSNLTAMSSNLFELLKGGSLDAYPDPEIRLSVQRAVSIETSRGQRITKEKASHKIDVVVALAMSALSAVEHGQGKQVWFV